jgi:hypothetical protein
MVQVSLNKENQVVTAYPNNPEFGYVILKSEETIMDNGWLKIKSRTTLMRGETKLLQNHFSAGQTLSGRIQVIECTEDNIPAKQSSQLDKNAGFEEAIAPFLKRAGGEDAPVLMSDDKRILRFTDYDASGESTDVRVAHTNTDAVKAYNSAKASGSAQLPTG